MVERLTRSHVMGDIGDGDDQAEAAGIRFGEHRVVEVARVLAVDGDQRDVAQVGRGGRAEPPRAALGLLEGVDGECLGDIVRMDGDQADRARIAHGAKPLDDAGRLQAEAMVGQGFAQHDLAFRGAALLAARHQPFRLGPAIRRHDRGRHG